MTFFVCELCQKRVNENPIVELYLSQNSRGFAKKTEHYLCVCSICKQTAAFEKMIADMGPDNDSA